MTRKEQTGRRSLQFSQWIREMLPDSGTGFLVSDLDFILCNYKGKSLMLIEVKTRNATLRTWQKKLFENLDGWIRRGIDNDWIYFGYHVIKFEHTFFNDGKCFFDNKEVTEKELISRLSL